MKKIKKIKIRINGKIKTITDHSTLAKLIIDLKIPLNKVELSLIAFNFPFNFIFIFFFIVYKS